MSSILAIAERWKRVQSATVCDVQANQGALRPHIRSLTSGAQLAGPAVTVLPEPGDLLAVEKVIGLLEPGQVLVVAGAGMEVAYWGAGMCCWAIQHGCAGLVVDGYVRDLDQISAWGFPMFALGTMPRAATFSQAGHWNIPVMVGGVVIEPGDWLRGDNDGIVVIPRAKVNEILAAAEAAQPHEDEILDQLAAGIAWQQIYGERGRVQLWERKLPLLGKERE